MASHGTSQLEHEVWCDTTSHEPDQEGMEDPGCHRWVQYGRLYVLITRHHTGQIVAAIDRVIIPVEEFREYIRIATEHLAYIPLQRTA
jgi:hypothetical protein